MQHTSGSFSHHKQGPLEKLRCTRVVSGINDFLRSPWYILLIALMTALSSLLALDLVLYSVLIVVAIYISFLGRDYLPLMPIVIFCYIGPSIENNPGRYPNSVFYPANGGIYLCVLATIFVVSVIFRLTTDQFFGGKRFISAKRSLTVGMLILGGAYLLSGLFMDGYGEIAANNLLFAFIQFLAIFAMYYFFTGSVRWENAPKDYLAWLGVCAGFVVLIQLLENYLSGRIFIGTTMDRELIATGWGMHNNIGCMMAITLPFAFYLAGHKKHGWIFNILGTILLLGTVISCSRTSMMVAAIAYCICAFLLLRNRQTRKVNLLVYLFAGIVVVVAVLIFFDKLLSIFELFISELGSISQRDNLITYGLKQFFGNPIFGGSFFPQGEYVPWDWANLESFSSFFPPRWHNTIIQIAASCGVVGLAAYAFHRFQTVKLFLRNHSPEKTFIGISILVLLAASLLDCHFFNVGPVLLYSIALAFAERIHLSKE